MSKRKAEDGNDQVHLDQRTRDSTICVPASKEKCKVDGLMELIREVVPEANKAAYYAMLLANTFVTMKLSRGQSLPKLNKDFFFLCICRVSLGCRPPTKTKCAQLGIEEAYTLLWGDSDGLVSTPNHENIRLLAATEMATAAGLYNTKAFYHHFVQYIRCRYNLRFKGHAKFICGRIMVKDDADPLDYVSIPERLELSESELNDIILSERDVFLAVRKSERYTEYRYEMMQEIERLSTNERPLKSFTIIPERHCNTKFVTLDLTSLKSLWMRKRPCDRGRWRNPEQERQWHKWNEVNEMNTKLEDWFHIPKRGRKWDHGFSLKTNGFEFHFTFDMNKVRHPVTKRAKKPKEEMTIKNKDWDPPRVVKNKMGLDIHDPTNFAASDVGHYNILTSFSPYHFHRMNGTRNGEIRNYTKWRFNFESKRNKVNRKVKLLQRDLGIRVCQNILSQHTMKTTSLENMRKAVLVRCKFYDALYVHYSNRQYMKLKMEARIANQRAIDDMLNWVTYGKSKILGIGDGSKTTGFKGTSPGGPTKKIKRHAIKCGYEVVLVNEAYTSKRSACCHGHDLKPMKRTAANGEKEDIHGLRICKKCGRTWDRDVSAALNIFDVFYDHMVLGGPRPPHLLKTVIPGAQAHGGHSSYVASSH